MAFIVALSLEKGYFHFQTFVKSVNQHKFIEFLKQVKLKIGNIPFAIYLDNLAAHKTKLVKEYMRENDIEPVYSPVYSPQYQPSEYLIGLIKNKLRKQILENLYFDKIEKYDKLLKMKSSEIHRD